ncbi:FecR family protein [Mucilaginibacter gilvus]|uniref:FecR family protein n=1 Tax=Mucilaginibacter gilvus TaxID=2305909 RepID=A0A444MIV9_9SPHI|nr:FecR family protein [Mucilaginibacter gilvus]RWY48044.1 FecR family protein [Mucilaginibacter gilvus]
MGNDKFIELVSKHLTNDITPAESAELKHLITNFPAYKQQFDDLGMYWDHTDNEYTDDAIAFQKIQDKIKRLDDKAESEPNDSKILLPLTPKRKNKNTFRLWPVAAAAIVLVAAGSYLLNAFVFSAHTGAISTAGWQQKTTSRGAKSIITLSDGTRITLNSQSTIKYPASFSGNTREVTLTGEAYFDVKKDKEHPFIIHTDKMNVRVLGTTFNVRSYPQDTVSETTLINGAIEVTLNDRPSDRIILKPKEKLIVKNNGSGDAKKPTNAGNGGNTQVAQYVLTSLNYIGGKDSSVSETSWINNRFSFENDSFAVLAEKMERWYGVDIQFKNDKVKQYNFSGVFENDTIIQALNALRDIEKFDYKISGSTIYIY